MRDLKAAHEDRSARFGYSATAHGGKTFAALLVLAAGLAAPRPVAAEEPVRAHHIVYVESNDPAGNAVFAFARGSDGELTPLPGSPFSAGGLGITPTFDLGPFDSDQNLIVNRDHTRLFAVNGGSDSIAVFRVAPDGSLAHVEGSPFPSGGSNPVSVGLAGDVLCVVNKDQDPGHPGAFLPNYTAFRVNPHGKLTPIPHSTFTVDAGASPSQALTALGGRLVFGADFLGGLLRSFQIAANGRLQPVAALPLPPAEFAGTNAPPLPLGLAVHPRERLLYVGFVTINRLGVYRFNDSGQLGFVRTVPNSGNALCWVTINKDATRLYTSNTGDPSISVYDISQDPTRPVEIQRVFLRSMGNGFQFALDSTGQFLHVVTQQASPSENFMANGLNVLKVNPDGTLTEVPSSPTLLPVPNLVRPQGVVAL